jgi:hypothetical protein
MILSGLLERTTTRGPFSSVTRPVFISYDAQQDDIGRRDRRGGSTRSTTGGGGGGGGRRLGENSGRSRVSDKRSSGRAASGFSDVARGWASVAADAPAAIAMRPRSSAFVHRRRSCIMPPSSARTQAKRHPQRCIPRADPRRRWLPGSRISQSSAIWPPTPPCRHHSHPSPLTRMNPLPDGAAQHTVSR